MCTLCHVHTHCHDISSCWKTSLEAGGGGALEEEEEEEEVTGEVEVEEEVRARPCNTKKC